MYNRPPLKRPAQPLSKPKPSKSIWDDDDDDDDDDALDALARPAKRRMLDLDNDLDEDGDGVDTHAHSSIGKAATPTPVAQKDNEEEEDELDAFMANINAEIKQQDTAPNTTKPSAPQRQEFESLEEEDHIESYIAHMARRGIEIGKGTGGQARLDNADEVDSDEEVYATARAVDAALGGDPDDDGMGPRRGEIEPLAPTDHSVITYEEINKDFYEEHEDIKRLSDADVERVRRELDMHVRGVGVAKPCISFAHFGFDDALVNVVRKLGYTEPTGIQRQAVPVALSGRDMIGIAKTGSGKTAAFVWPMLVHIMDQRELEKGEGPIGLILAPTRELAHQIYIETKKYAKAYGLNCACVYGGASKSDQFKDLRSPVEILVATPGRLLDLIKMKATNLRRVSYLVLDEADRMFDLGFEPQVRSLCTAVRPDRQTLLFSATMRKRVERLARDVLTDPVRISIGAQNAANADITQHIHVLPDDTYKWAWLTSHLPAFTAEGSVLVFIGRKAGVDALTDSLQGARVECAKLHGDMMQADRDRVVREFKAGKFKLLVCTDVAARGLDIKSVRTVINYDAPKDIETHIHRIGRTGRAGTKGDAHTLITQSEDRFAAELVRNLEESGVAVQSDVMGVAMRNGRFRKGREGFARGGRGRGRGGGRGRGRGRGVGFGQGGGSGGGANSVPLGGGGFARHPPPPSLGAPGGGYSRQPPPPTSYGAGTGFMAFQRAQSAQGSSTSFLGGTAQQQQPPPQRPPQQQPPQQPEQQRRRRWDT